MNYEGQMHPTLSPVLYLQSQGRTDRRKWIIRVGGIPLVSFIHDELTLSYGDFKVYTSHHEAARDLCHIVMVGDWHLTYTIELLDDQAVADGR